MGLGAALIGAGGAIVGGLIGKSGQEDANRTNLKIARENREWQQKMSNTAHRREVRDLRKAGLNPILSAKTGGASTPAGNVATMQNSAKSVQDGVSQAANIAAHAANLKANTQQMVEQAQLIHKKQETEVANARDAQNRADISSVAAHVARNSENALVQTEKILKGNFDAAGQKATDNIPRWKSKYKKLKKKLTTKGKSLYEIDPRTGYPRWMGKPANINHGKKGD